MFRLFNRLTRERQTLCLLAPIIAVLFILPLGARASVCDQNTILTFVANDPGGSYIAGAKVDVYEQTTDANGNTKPGKRFTGATTDAVLGQAKLSWRNSAVSSGTYAIRVQTVNKDKASFWFYDINLACGQTTSLNKTLSGLNITFRDSGGDILTNTNFAIYSQLRNNGGSLDAAKDEFMMSGSSGNSGRVKIYLPQGSVRSLDRSGPDVYVLEVNHGGMKSYFYGLTVHDGQLTNVDYYLSVLKVRLKDANNKSAVGAKVEVFNQDVDLNNEYKKGSKVGDFTIADNGYGSMEISSGLYALGVKGSDGQYQYFWDISVADGRTSEYLLNLNESATVASTCNDKANVTVTLRTVKGDIIPGLKFELYEQNVDANGLPYAGAKVANATIPASGFSTVSFKPNAEKYYALKVWDKRSDVGDFWFFSALKLDCGAAKSLTKTIPAVQVILRDGDGNLKRNYNFFLSAQAYDADNNPVIANNSLVANLQTNSGGQAWVYVSPYNPYRRGQSGIYALSTKDANNNIVNFFNITPTNSADYVFEGQTSGLSGILRDGRGRALANKSVALYSYSLDGGVKRLGSSLVTAKTEANGSFSFEYPAGTYALVTDDDFGQKNIFWGVGVKAGSSAQTLTMNLTNFSLADTLGEGVSSDPQIKIYALSLGSSGRYFRDREVGNLKLSGGNASKILAAGSYLAVYTGKGDKEYATAFYAANGKSQNIPIIIGSKSVISSGQTFSVSVSGSSGVSGGSAAASGGSTLPNLRGRILLQVEGHGEAWYVDTASGSKYYLGRPADAFNIMRSLALGISNSDFAAVYNNPSSWRNLAGKILLKTQDSGKAYYFDPIKLQLYYLGRPADAFNVMRSLGLGITNSNLDKIATGNK